MVVDKHNEQEAAKKAIEERKKAAELKQANTLKKALEKFTLYPNGLTVPDLKVLVTAFSNISDSHVKTRKAELQNATCLIVTWESFYRSSLMTTHW
jgi:hypothetical protein